MGDVHNLEGAEGEDDPREKGRPRISGEAPDEEERPEAAQDEAEEKGEIVGQDGISGQVFHRRRGEGLGKEMLGEGQRPGIRVEDVRLEEVEGAAESLMRNPGQDP